MPDGQVFRTSDIDQDLSKLADDGEICNKDVRVGQFLAYLEQNGFVYSAVLPDGAAGYEVNSDVFYKWYYEDFLLTWMAEAVRTFCAFHDCVFEGNALSLPATKGNNPGTILMKLAVYLTERDFIYCMEALKDPVLVLDAPLWRIVFPNWKNARFDDDSKQLGLQRQQQ